MQDNIQKGGKPAVIGEIRKFGGRDYIKTASGWKFHGRGTGMKAQEHKANSANGKGVLEDKTSKVKPSDIKVNGKKVEDAQSNTSDELRSTLQNEMTNQGSSKTKENKTTSSIETNAPTKEAVDNKPTKQTESSAKTTTPKKIDEAAFKRGVLKTFGVSESSIIPEGKHTHTYGYKPYFEENEKGIYFGFDTGKAHDWDSGGSYKQYIGSVSAKPYKGKYSANISVHQNKNSYLNESISSKWLLEKDFDTYEEAKTAFLKYLGYKDISKGIEDSLEKGGKRAVVGERRKFGGKDYIKQSNGEWKPVAEGRQKQSKPAD